MRKNRKQQKNKDGGQIELFQLSAGKSVDLETDGISEPISTEVELLSQLERNRTLTIL